jgi:two-component system cell cycle response regulator/two-component system cell cycle response regulator DivK
MSTQLDTLVVDDTPINVKLITALLRANGFTVTIATTGEAALDVMKGAQFRLLLLDLRLPGIDGLTLARRLRADPAHKQLVIVAVTASAMKTDVAAALEAGCDAFVSKPINTRTLIPIRPADRRERDLDERLPDLGLGARYLADLDAAFAEEHSCFHGFHVGPRCIGRAKRLAARGDTPPERRRPVSLLL